MSMRTPFTSLLSYMRSRSGLAYLEFAVTLPFLLALMLGAVEVTRYVLITQKVEKTSMTISDLVAQSTTIKTSDLDNIFLAGPQVMEPYSFNKNGYIIVTSVTQTGAETPANQPIVQWQYAGGGSMVETTHIGAAGAKAVLPAGFTLNDKDNIIITEVFYQFTPLLNTMIYKNMLLYRMSVFRPRLGALNALVKG